MTTLLIILVFIQISMHLILMKAIHINDKSIKDMNKRAIEDNEIYKREWKKWRNKIERLLQKNNQ